VALTLDGLRRLCRARDLLRAWRSRWTRHARDRLPSPFFPIPAATWFRCTNGQARPARDRRDRLLVRIVL